MFIAPARFGASANDYMTLICSGRTSAKLAMLHSTTISLVGALNGISSARTTGTLPVPDDKLAHGLLI
jgi:hypothetical protein